MGKIVDTTMATDPEIQCKGYVTKGKPLVWKRGIVGALSESQITEFCDRDVIAKLPKASGDLKKTLEGFDVKHRGKQRLDNICDLSDALAKRKEPLGANFCVREDKLREWGKVLNRVSSQHRFKEKDFECLVRVLRHIGACPPHKGI